MTAARRRPSRLKVAVDVALDLPMMMLPALVFVSWVSYIAWAWWWV